MIYYNNYLAVMKKYHFLNPKGVTAHNLLINGDFQVNQRGQSSYTCDGTKRVYGVDMWSFSKSNTFMKVTENGIETNAPISQMFNKLKSGMKYTIVCSVDNVVLVKSIVGGTYDTGTSQTIMYLTFNDVERIVITPNGTQAINYIDLYEGEIVYKHQKEDYAIALTRCQRQLYKGTFFGVIYGYAGGTKYYYQGVTNFPVEMVDVPAITFTSIEVPNVGFLSADKVFLRVTNKYIGKTSTADLGVSLASSNDYIRYPLIVDFIASCEPL